jgi:glucan phosphorylase
MKAASELGVPVVGVSLLYGQGYFRQDFDSVTADAKIPIMLVEKSPTRWR